MTIISDGEACGKTVFYRAITPEKLSSTDLLKQEVVIESEALITLVGKIAKALVEKKTLSEKEVKEICRDALLLRS